MKHANRPDVILRIWYVLQRLLKIAKYAKKMEQLVFHAKIIIFYKELINAWNNALKVFYIINIKLLNYIRLLQNCLKYLHFK